MNIDRYDVSGRCDSDGDEIPPIIKKDPTGGFVYYRDVKRLMGNEVILNRIILSDRNIPLVYQFNEDISEPVLTVENYTKWYDLYLVNHDRSVNKVGFDALHNFTPKDESPYSDHVPNPKAVKCYADKYSYHLDEQSFEMMTGRWVIDCDKSIGTELDPRTRHRFEESISPRCSACGGKLFEIHNDIVPEYSDDLAPSMKGKKYLFTGEKCERCETRVRGQFVLINDIP
jgi:hypothetical protein